MPALSSALSSTTGQRVPRHGGEFYIHGGDAFFSVRMFIVMHYVGYSE
jgi:hypothetical protein